MRALLAAFVLPLILAGCGSSSGLKSGPAPVSTGQGDWKVYAPKGGDYRIALPAGWITIDAQSLAAEMASGKVGAELKSQIAGFRAVASPPGTLVGLDHSSAGNRVEQRAHFTPNILVRRAETGLTLPDAKILAQVVKTLQTSTANLPGLTGPVIGHGTMAHLPAESRAYTFDEPLPSGKTARVTERDEFTVDNGTLYGVTCTSTVDDYPRVDGLCDHALSTFSLTG